MDRQINRKAIEDRQVRRLRRMLDATLPANEFYRRKCTGADPRQIDSLDQFHKLPLTTKDELVEDHENIRRSAPMYALSGRSLRPHPPNFGSDEATRDAVD